MKGKGNLSFGSVKGPKGLTDEFYGFIKTRRLLIVIDSYLIDSARSLTVYLKQLKGWHRKGVTGTLRHV